MSEFTREIGGFLFAQLRENGIAIIDCRDNSTVVLEEDHFQNLIRFRGLVQTEIASRQRLEPLPEIKPITTVLKKLTP